MNKAILTRYLFAELTTEEMKQVEAWRKESAENDTVFRNFVFAQLAVSDLSLMDSLDTDEALLRLKMRLQCKQNKGRSRLTCQMIKIVAAAFFIPGLFLAGYFLSHFSVVEPIPHMVEITTNPGVVSKFRLPDNTLVCLNAGSRLNYPSNFNAKERWVALAGEAYFDVAKGTVPFLVRVDSFYTVRVLGTTFNIHAYEEDNFIKTTLVNGEIELQYLNENRRAEWRRLDKNMFSYYLKDLKSMEIEEADIDADMAWKYGRLVFDNHPLKQVVQALSRFYNVRFEIANEHIYDSAITGKFDNEQLPQVLNYIKEATGINYRIKKPVVTEDGFSKQEVILTK